MIDLTNFWLRLFVAIVGMPTGYYFMRYKDRIVQSFGKMGWAEKYLGDGGTYNAWVMIGMAVFAGSFLFLFNAFPGQGSM